MNASDQLGLVGRAARRLAVVALVVTGLTLASAALAGSAAAQEQRLHQVNWAHPTPSEVSRFVILISPVEGSLAQARQVDVGKPEPQPIGSLTLFSAMVSFAEDEYLAVAAVGHTGLMSVPSDWSGMPPSRPGQPLPIDH